MPRSVQESKYYCFTDKKCKKIPRGYFIGARGYLARGDNRSDSGNGNAMVTEVLTEMGTRNAAEMVTVVLVVMVVARMGGEWVNR